MTIRHKSKKVSLSTGLVSEWNDDHHADFDDEILRVWDFTSSNLDDSLAKVETNEGTVTISMTNNHNFCNVISSVTAGGLAVLKVGTADVTNKLDLPIFTVAVKLETTDQIEFGFFRTADTPFTANQRGAYFRIKTGKVYAVTGNGTSETEVEIDDVNTYDQYKIEFTSSDVRFYVGDIHVLDQTNTTYIPTEDLTIKISAKVSDSTSQIARVDAFALSRLRKK